MVLYLADDGACYINRDVVAAIRRFSYNNINEFYRRYQLELNMSKSTFCRILSGRRTVPEKISRILALTDSLHLTNVKSVGSTDTLKRELVMQFVEVVDKFLKKPTIQRMINLRDFINQNRKGILS